MTFDAYGVIKSMFVFWGELMDSLKKALGLGLSYIKRNMVMCNALAAVLPMIIVPLDLCIMHILL